MHCFSFRNKKAGLYQSACKLCLYAQQKAIYHDESTGEKKLRRERNKRWARKQVDDLREFKEGKACTDCGCVYPPYVLDFDHRDPTTKEFNIAMHVRQVSRQRLLDEIAKCDIVCANCHRIRTFGSRAGKV